jgi:uncharacterized membrane protein YhhN
MPAPITMLGAYAAVSVLHVAGHVASLPAVTTVTKPLLMLTLAAFLISASPRPFTRMVRIVLGALAFSWLGDVLLEVSRLTDSDGLFMAGLGGFLVAQVLYIVAFTPLVRSSSPPRPPMWALMYVLYGAGLVAFLAPELGEFLLPVVVYAAAICTMGIVAAGVNGYTALGAALFVASDTLIAVGRFSDLLTIAVNWQRVLVMTTYLLAQGLIVVGVVVAQRGIWRTVPEPALPTGGQP